MPITATCASCGIKVRAPDEAAGKMAHCPKCKAQIRIPTVISMISIDSQAPYVEVVSPDPRPSRRPAYEPENENRIDDYDPPPARSSRRARRSRHDDENDEVGFVCPFCSIRRPPRVETKISVGGWIVFVVLLLFLCWPICWVGLLMKDEYRVCSGCGVRLG